MFRLEAEIRRWRKGFESDLAFTEEDIVELESHLRESFEINVRKGMGEPEAFKLACSALGGRKTLRREYNHAKPALWVTFSFLRALYLIAGLIVFGITLVYKLKTGHSPAFLYSSNAFDIFDAFTFIVWWLPVLTVMTAFLLMRNTTVKIMSMLLATVLIVEFMSGPYLITGHITDTQSLFRTSFLVLITSLFFKSTWGWRLSIIVTGVYIVSVSIPMLPSLAFLGHIPLQATVVIFVTSLSDPLVGILLGYALFREATGYNGLKSLSVV